MYYIKRQNRRKKIKKLLLFNCPQKKGTCFKVTFMKPKKPNSATRKVTKVTFMSQRRKTFCHIPGIKHNLQKFSTILMRGGRVRDLPGVKYRVIRGIFDLRPVYNRFKARSKYGVKKN